VIYLRRFFCSSRHGEYYPAWQTLKGEHDEINPCQPLNFLVLKTKDVALVTALTMGSDESGQKMGCKEKPGNVGQDFV